MVQRNYKSSTTSPEHEFGSRIRAKHYGDPLVSRTHAVSEFDVVCHQYMRHYKLLLIYREEPPRASIITVYESQQL